MKMHRIVDAVLYTLIIAFGVWIVVSFVGIVACNLNPAADISEYNFFKWGIEIANKVKGT